MAGSLTWMGLAVAQVGNWFNACGGTNYRVEKKISWGHHLKFHIQSGEKNSITSFLN